MNKSDAVKFLNSLIEKYPNDAAPMLIDVIIHYMLFPKGDQENLNLTKLDQRVSEIMRDPNRKVEAVKLVRDELKCDLKEALDYVNNRVWRSTLDVQSENAESVLNKIRLDYKLD